MKYIEGTKPTNEKHIANLKKLADLLKSDLIPPPRFHMGEFAIALDEEVLNDPDFDFEDRNEYDIEYFEPKTITREDYTCGTVCCALGHGPLAGVEAKEYYTWDGYAKYEFGAAGETDIWYWLFSYDWANIDNTAKGAAKRIEIYLENGLPENWEEQLYGKEQLMY